MSSDSIVRDNLLTTDSNQTQLQNKFYSISFLAGFLFLNIRFIIIPSIILAATDVIVIIGLFGSPNLNANPPIPATKIVLATNIFFVFEKSIFSFINILIPLDAMNPYKPWILHP